MEIELKKITVRELTKGYRDDGEGGVVGYGGKLDIRPPHQREFVYDDKQRNAVIGTILKGFPLNEFPLNVMYWADKGNETYEVIDGQQRTISIARYVNEEFSFNKLSLGSLPEDKQEWILDYKLLVYICKGKPSEKLEWFKTINVAGEKLTKQELRNAVYAGPWVSDAKRYFSQTGCAAYHVGKPYVKGTPIRQDYLETVIKWASGGDIEGYMDKHRGKLSAEDLWKYFENVIDWIKKTFPEERPPMRGVNWGVLYTEYKDVTLVPDELEEKVVRLILDDDVTNKKGIYPYVLTRDERQLNIRAFTKAQKLKAYERQNRGCANKECSTPADHVTFRRMEGDHIMPWSEGGKTSDENCQMLCKECHNKKTAR